MEVLYLLLILVLVGVLFWINFGYSDDLPLLSSIFGPNSFKTKSNDFWFAMFTESITVFVTFLVVILFIKMGEERDRKPIYTEAYDDARQIYDEIYKFIYHIMAHRMKIEMLDPYKEWLESCRSMENKIDTYEIIKSFFEDICTKSICVNKKNLETRIDYIYSESENYLQRFGAFLTSEATGDEGSNLQKYFNSMRRLSRKLKRSIDSQQTGEFIRIQICKSSTQPRRHSICLGSDSETIDIPSTIIESMKNRHLELRQFSEKSGKSKTANFDFLTIGYLMEELDRVGSDSINQDNSINRDDCILTWTILFEKFKESCDISDASETAFNNAEFDFWCMYWDYRHQFLENAKTKSKTNNLSFGNPPENIQNAQNGPKDFAKVIRKEREHQCGPAMDDHVQDGDQSTAKLQGTYKIFDVCNNDEKAIDAFRRMEGSSDDGK